MVKSSTVINLVFALESSVKLYKEILAKINSYQKSLLIDFF